MLFAAAVDAAANGEEQTQTSPEKGPQITRSRTIEICGLNSLTSSSSKRLYDHAIREFIDWYFPSAARTRVAGANAAAAAATRKLRRFIMLHPHLLSLAQQKQLPNI